LELVSESAALEIELLLSHVIKKDRIWLKTWPDFQLKDEQVLFFNQLFDRRLQGEPLAFILGFKGFWTLDYAVNYHTLIPRPETELLVEIALSLEFNDNSKVIDLGTGTGAIALALASERPSWQIDATDVVHQALELAEFNRNMFGLTNVNIFYSDWFDSVSRRDSASSYDLIVSNPPYIEQNNPHLQQGDVRFEPSSALVAGLDGLDALRIIIEQAPMHLSPHGWLLVEHGYDQGNSVRRLFDLTGFKQIKTHADLNLQDRVTAGCLIAPP
jgi:release factor glutamine methyltransferase